MGLEGLLAAGDDTAPLYSIYPPGMMPADDAPRLAILGVCVGNTRTQYGVVRGERVESGATLPNDELEKTADQVARLQRDLSAAGEELPVVLASVNPPVANRLETLLVERHQLEVSRLGRDLNLDINHSLDDASTVGQDRVLNAMGAFAMFKKACVVVDAGTAVTVDFVDGVGTFHGGAIAPGLDMMLRALHERTAALPALEFAQPDAQRGPLGKDTSHAMLLGVQAAAVGLVHRLIDRYAEFYGGYPSVIATGGNATALFEGDELVEHVVPDLQLIGLGEACRREIDEDR